MALDQAKRDAVAYLNALLADYGLGSLASWAYDQVVKGLSAPEVGQQLRERPEYKTRFKANDERAKRGLAPLSPAEIIAYERQAADMFHAAGLPRGFYDQPSDFVDLIGKGTSLAELSARVEDGYVRVMQEDQGVRDELRRLHGVTEGHMAAWFLDGGRALPLIQREVAMARVGAASIGAGFGPLSTVEADSVARQGVTGDQAQQGFARLAGAAELFAALDRGEDAITREEQLGAEFAGNANAQRRIEDRARRRRSQFEGGGGFATTREGFGGLGAAR